MTIEDRKNAGNVKVCIRVRPLNKREKGQENCRSIVNVVDSHILVFDPVEDESANFTGFGRRKITKTTNRASKDLRFAFDQVFHEGVTNEEVFENTTKGLIDALLGGFNCSVFAYGATGAGKTHTMLGSADNPGVMFQTMLHLFNRIEQLQTESVCKVAIAYLEVYNEQIRDLLADTGTLPLREDPNKNVVISGLSMHRPSDAYEVLSMLEKGNSRRTQHPTDANSESSRSHAVLQVFVEQRPREAGLSADVRSAKLQLVDLAGSERAQSSNNRGARMREGANINRSLLALGSCINALTDSKNKGKHIPYRNSKLTRILKDSLGGNCHTIMIAALSPWSGTYEDTLNTLRYADRAKHIRTCVKRNEHSVAFHLAKYSNIVSDLKKQISELQDKLEVYEKREINGVINVASPNTLAAKQRVCTELRRLQDESNAAEKELLDCRASLQHISARREKLERLKTTLQALGYEHPVTQTALARLERVQQSTDEKQTKLESRREELMSKASTLRVSVSSASQAALKHRQTDGHLPQEILALLTTGGLSQREQLLVQSHTHSQISQRALEAELTQSNIHLQQALELCARQQCALLSTAGGAMTDTLQQQYTDLVHALARSRSVTFAQNSSDSSLPLELPEANVLDLKTLLVPPARSAQSPWVSARRILMSPREPNHSGASPTLPRQLTAAAEVPSTTVPPLNLDESLTEPSRKESSAREPRSCNTASVTDKTTEGCGTQVSAEAKPDDSSVVMKTGSTPKRVMSPGPTRTSPGVTGPSHDVHSKWKQASRTLRDITEKKSEDLSMCLTSTDKANHVNEAKTSDQGSKSKENPNAVGFSSQNVPSYAQGTLASRIRSGQAKRVLLDSQAKRVLLDSQAKRGARRVSARFTPYGTKREKPHRLQHTEPRPGTIRVVPKQAPTPLRKINSHSVLPRNQKHSSNDTFVVGQPIDTRTVTKATPKRTISSTNLLNVTVTKKLADQPNAPVIKPAAAKVLFDTSNTPEKPSARRLLSKNSVSCSALIHDGEENRPHNTHIEKKSSQKPTTLTSLREKLSVLMKGGQSSDRRRQRWEY